MAAKCFPLVGGRVMRITRLDGCGRPVFGECSRVVSDGFVSVAATASTDDGNEISVTNANGRTCVRQEAKVTLLGFELEITFCAVDPDALALTSGQDTVLDPETGEAIGFNINVDVDLEATAFALELWSNVPGVACENEDADGAWGYLLYPYIKGGIIGDHTIENDAVSFVVTGAKTKSGGGWGTGPYNVRINQAAVPQPLATAMASGDHLRVFVTEYEPPEPECGCLPLDDPEAEAPTTAVAGIPGTWTPTDSNRPDDFDALVTLDPTASPATAWTTGQYIVLEDGSEAHWDSTDWVEGRA